MPLKFGTSGVRGLVTELSDSEVYTFTTAFLNYAKTIGQTSAVAVARDLRESSPQIQKAVTHAIVDFGSTPIICEDLPTPAIAFYAQQKKCLAIMITGSHIPADRNGIKFYLETGETLKKDDQAIFELYENLKAQGLKMSSQGDFKSSISGKEARETYSNRYTHFFPKDALSGYKILFYQHSSVARKIFPEILKQLGAEVIPIGYSDIFIPVDTEAVEAVDNFKSWILEHNADALISTDGDADRPLLLDDTGAVIPGDKIGALTSLYLESEAIAFPISCNSGICQIKSFKKTKLTKIGSPYVVEALNELSKEYSNVAGFEANGGFILQSDILTKEGRILQKLPTRDAVLPILSALLLAKEKNLKISETKSLLPSIFTASGLLKNFPAEKSFHILDTIKGDPSAFFRNNLKPWDLPLLDVENLDGIRCRFNGDLVIHLRPSGNAPEFRCYTEAKEQSMADKLCMDVVDFLKK
jgi:phosphomannomutase